MEEKVDQLSSKIMENFPLKKKVGDEIKSITLISRSTTKRIECPNCKREIFIDKRFVKLQCKECKTIIQEVQKVAKEWYNCITFKLSDFKFESLDGNLVVILNEEDKPKTRKVIIENE